MQFVADLHIHSKYSRAVSQNMVLEELDRWADDKGILVMGTGDFTHPGWFKEIKHKLEPAEPGLFKLKPHLKKKTIKGTLAETRFLLSVEISGIYSKNGKTRRIHNIVLAPDLETADKLNTQLSWIGNLASDGRPILGLDSEELAKIVFNTNPRAVIIPAHCLLPNTLIHTQNNLLKPIQDIKVGDLVLTHKNQWQKVEQILKRPYNGKIYHIKPRYFSLGLATTSEHPFFAIKTRKNCHWSKGICKPDHEYLADCKAKYYKNYKLEWITAEKLEVGDVLIYPRFLKAFQNHKSIDLKEVIEKSKIDTRVKEGLIVPVGNKVTPIRQFIPVDKNFCRLAGYYLAEGYTNSRDLIGFAFSSKEKLYIDEVRKLMRIIFGFDKEPKIKTSTSGGTEILFYSKILCRTFQNLFYCSKDTKNASTKSLPMWALGLPLDLQVEIFRCWWRGDNGYTASRMLMNQMKIILLRLGIIPSIYFDNLLKQLKRGQKYIGNREIYPRYGMYAINRLSFFEDKFGLLETSEFLRFKSKSDRKYGWIDNNYIYLPIFDIEISDHKGEVYNLEVESDNSYVSEFATIHNCWTPWFSVFGSMSGFDSLEECFGAYTKNIFAIETGLSSDPPMNWRFSKLDKIALVSNSDSHSLQRIGREANVFDCELSYDGIIKAIKDSVPSSRINADQHQRGSAQMNNQRKSAFLYTIEFFPEEGKYHYDGHRACGIVFSPADTKKHKGICPKCGKPLTIGVVNRVGRLADSDRPEGYQDPKRIPYKSLVTLDSIIGEALDVGKAAKSVMKEYEKLIRVFNSEFNILLNASIKEIAMASKPEIAEGVERMRQGKITIQPGYDGEFGVIKIFDEAEKKQIKSQTALF